MGARTLAFIAEFAPQPHPSSQPASRRLSLAVGREAEAHEAEKAARRRSTVREKVSFGSHAPAEAASRRLQPALSRAASAETPAEPAADATSDDLAATRGMVVAALRRRRIVSSRSHQIQKNRPAKPGGFLTSLRDPRFDANANSVVTAVSMSVGSTCLLRLASQTAAIELAFPPRHDDTGDAVAAKIGQRAALAHELVDAKHDRHARHETRIDHGERCRESDKACAGDTRSAFRGEHRNQEDRDLLRQT